MGNIEKVGYYKALYEVSKEKNAELRKDNAILREELLLIKRKHAKVSKEYSDHLENTNHEALQDLSAYAYLSKRKAKVAIVKHEVCKVFGISTGEITQRNRKRPIVMARQVAHEILSKKLLGYSLVEVGEVVGKLGHASVLNSIKVVYNLLEVDPEFKEMYHTALNNSLKQIKKYEQNESQREETT